MLFLVSDTASQDSTLDKSGPLLEEILPSVYKVTEKTIVPDEVHDIRKVVERWSQVNLILITGGTGFSPRDVTPEAIQPLLTRETPGITHLILQSSIAITPFAALSRPITGIKDKTMIITLPGSPKACKENMEAILKVLPHALDLLMDRSVKKFHAKVQQGDTDHVCTHKHDVEGHASQTGHSVPLDTPGSFMQPLSALKKMLIASSVVSRRARSSPYPIIPVQKALEIVADHAKVLNVINMPVSQFLPGYVLAEDVVSLEPVPGYRASTMDGYAVYGKGTLYFLYTLKYSHCIFVQRKMDLAFIQ